MPTTLFNGRIRRSDRPSKIELYENGVLVFQNARIIFRNFSGKPSKYNKNGDRNFCVILPTEEIARKLAEQGWNARIKAPRSDDEDPLCYISVAVNFNHRPPKIEMHTNRATITLTEETVDDLDYAEIDNIDLSINPRAWEDDDGNLHIKAYLKSMIVDLAMDELERMREDDEMNMVE